jgi:hypothetical protein
MALTPSGKRDKLVTIQSRPTADAVDSSGAPVENFTDMLPKVWMAKKVVSEGERFAENFTANQLSARVFTEWNMPYQSTMDPDALDVPKLRRLVYQGRVYDITSAHLDAAFEGKSIRLVTIASSKVPS